MPVPNAPEPSGVTPSPEQAREEVIAATPIACQEINTFSKKVFKTRGGRMGSGMGVLLEALWAYYVDQGRPARVAGNEGWEIGWLPDNEYNDFACIQCDMPWESDAKKGRKGEFFRIEAKSMNKDADESKGHFDELQGNLADLDLLLVLIWWWKPIERGRVCPIIVDHFIGPARPVAVMRDKLHTARGGSFVERSRCPDGCKPAECTHHGEPLNSEGNRERSKGPDSCRSKKSPSQSNFGGLKRMLGAVGAARKVFKEARAVDHVAHAFISFMHKNFPSQEESCYSTDDWKEVASNLGIPVGNLPKSKIVAKVRPFSGYMDALRRLGE
jgi:hypothetical protein